MLPTATPEPGGCPASTNERLPRTRDAPASHPRMSGGRRCDAPANQRRPAPANNASRRPVPPGLNGGMRIERFDPGGLTRPGLGPATKSISPARRSAIRTARRCRYGLLPAGWPAAGLRTSPKCGRPARHLTGLTVVTRSRCRGARTDIWRMSTRRSRLRGGARASELCCCGMRRRRRPGWAGRRSLSDARDGSAGEAFARSLGARRGVTEVLRLLDLAAIPAGKLAVLRAESRAAACGYSGLSWAGTVPEEYLGQVAAVHGAMADAPHDAAVQALTWDADRVRAGQRRIVLQGLR